MGAAKYPLPQPWCPLEAEAIESGAPARAQRSAITPNRAECDRFGAAAISLPFTERSEWARPVGQKAALHHPAPNSFVEARLGNERRAR